MRISRTAQVRIPWALVGVFLACAVITAVGFALGDPAVAVTGAAIVVAIVVVSGLALIILPGFGISDRVSFATDFPNSARGPRGAGPH